MHLNGFGCCYIKCFAVGVSFCILPPPPPHILPHLPFPQSSSGTYTLLMFQTNEDTLESISRTEISLQHYKRRI